MVYSNNNEIFSIVIYFWSIKSRLLVTNFFGSPCTVSLWDETQPGPHNSNTLLMGNIQGQNWLPVETFLFIQSARLLDLTDWNHVCSCMKSTKCTSHYTFSTGLRLVTANTMNSVHMAMILMEVVCVSLYSVQKK